MPRSSLGESDVLRVEAMSASGSPPGQVETALATIKQVTNQETTSLDDLLYALGRRSYGPVLFVIGLVALSPLGSVPGASLVCATLVALLAAQMSLRAGAPWIPCRLGAVEVNGAQARRAIEWIEPYVRKLAVLTRPRWQALLNGLAIHAAVGTLFLLAALMYPLALVPWGVLPCAAGITAIGLGLLSRDGLFIAAGMALAAAAVAFGLIFTFA
jgi:hypothetical protein